jgi:glutamate dehydrogenase
MAVKTESLEAELVDSVCARIRDHVSGDEAAQAEAFARQYYHWVPPEDLADRSPDDLYGAALAHWQLALERKPGEAKIRVYNPDPDRDGLGSPHTAVEVVSDDMPFLVDSITMALGREGHGIDLVIHPVLHVVREEKGGLTEVLEPGGEPSEDTVAESVLHAEVTREPDEERRERLRAGVERVLEEVSAVVEDWGPMRDQLDDIVEGLDARPEAIDRAEVDEAKEFLKWLADDHFTFLGYREYDIVSKDAKAGPRVRKDTGLGILRGTPDRQFTQLSAKALELARAPHLLVITKANSRATVHRPSYLDYVGVKEFSEDGEVVGERRFLGLFTHFAYKESPQQIPLLRDKVREVLDRAGFEPSTHDFKALLEILEAYPRDSLFQMKTDELFEIGMGILGLGERQRLRLFVRRDPLDRFMACLVCIPRDRFNTQNRERVGQILLDEFGGSHLDWSIQLSESLLARVHYVIHCPDGLPDPDDYNNREIERRLVQAIRGWADDLRGALNEQHNEHDATELFRRYESAFPPAYRDDWSGRAAVDDISNLERLSQERGPIITLYRAAPEEGRLTRCKLFSDGDVALSDVVPTLEHMGVRVVDERPYEIVPSGSDPVWIYDFGLSCHDEDAERVRPFFEETFLGVWHGELEDDGLNGLVLKAGLTGTEVVILRAAARYLRQVSIPFSDTYMVRTLLRHPQIAILLVRLFKARFDPDRGERRDVEEISDEIEAAIDRVESLDEDRILRSFLSVVQGILRTNYFRTEGPGPAEGLALEGGGRPFLSFKVDPAEIRLMPLPRPKFEIFVYSPSVEGVHLRGGKVARGGLRWSDRPEDFRTEILGLMKAQMVKNALIVPVGSKGGFVVKRPPPDGDREAVQEEAIACYRTFLSGLLDVTDNIESGKVVPPPQVVRYDDDDPYLVVAADKGTASFSDIANEVSADYGFWLGDAFASGGSNGYDHKAMGITARGAWEAVKRHFRELGSDIQSADFTVVGIGDMSGDVFGNGMLLSRHIKLVAAFDHMHVFLDPNPDPKASFKERKRLFEMERSSWSDYNESVISAGGGIYPRTAKSIPISKQVKQALGIDDDELPPPELISAILKAPVDLLWNGGIGTYVKASTETHADAGDKANDPVRVDGAELRCKVVGEGGNLGLTQAARIEYALRGGPEHSGGRINTDATDNVAGVNCSDHEVNIKILLDSIVSKRRMSEKERNELLVEMTDAVGESVLYGSYAQTQALSLALAQAAPMVDVHARLIRRLEQVAGLDRGIEFLPDEDAIEERKVDHKGLVSPELAVLMAYCKIHLYAELLESDVPEDPYLGRDLERYFPEPVQEHYSRQMQEHRLRREIIATLVANQLVDRAGSTFAFRLGEETGASVTLLARGYAVARAVFDMEPFWEQVESLDNKVDAHVQLEMLIDARRLVERATRWLVRANPRKIEIDATAKRYARGAELLSAALPGVLHGGDREGFDARVRELEGAGVPSALSERVAAMPQLLAVFDIVEIAKSTKRPPEAVMETYFTLGAEIVLTWLRDRIIELPRANRWQALARAALRDDLYSLHRSLTEEVLEVASKDDEPEAAIATWRERNEAAVERCLGILDDIKVSRVYDTTTLPVALREVRNLIRESDGDEPAKTKRVDQATATG